MNISTRISIPRKAKLCHETSSDEKGKNKRRSPSITPSRRISTRSFRDNAITPSPQELRKLTRKAQLQQEPSSEQSLKNRQCSPLINLCDDMTCTMHQGRSGSDVCEHEFARAKDGNPNPTCAQISDATSAGNGYRLTGDAFKLDSKTNSSHKSAYLSELNAPIERNNQN